MVEGFSSLFGRFSANMLVSFAVDLDCTFGGCRGHALSQRAKCAFFLGVDVNKGGFFLTE